MVHVGIAFGRYGIVLARLDGEPLECVDDPCAVIGLAIELLNVYPKPLDVHGVVNHVQLRPDSCGVGQQCLEDLAVDVVRHILGEVSQAARSGLDIRKAISQQRYCFAIGFNNAEKPALLL
jgi:hypothetical protein